MKPHNIHGLSSQIFLWFWSMLLLILAVVISLPSLDPRNTIPLPPKEQLYMKQHVSALLQGPPPTRRSPCSRHCRSPV